MLRVQGRIRRLEQVLQVNDHEPPSVHEISFVDGDGTITGTMVCSSDPRLYRPYIATPGYEENA
jgi:hypothetical protein